MRGLGGFITAVFPFPTYKVFAAIQSTVHGTVIARLKLPLLKMQDAFNIT
jgi:hypothetical protein